MTDPNQRARELLAKLSSAQQEYLAALEPNSGPSPDKPAWVQETERSFHRYSHRKAMKGQSLPTAHALVRKGLVKHRPEPCECGWHYVSLTDEGRAIAERLATQEKG